MLTLRGGRWSVPAIAVVAIGAAMVVLLALAVWWSRRKKKDETDLLVKRRMQDLRVKLRMRRQDGFMLSTERSGFHLLGGEARIVQAKHLEALARMTLLYDFEVSPEEYAWGG